MEYDGEIFYDIDGVIEGLCAREMVNVLEVELMYDSSEECGEKHLKFILSYDEVKKIKEDSSFWLPERIQSVLDKLEKKNWDYSGFTLDGTYYAIMED